MTYELPEPARFTTKAAFTEAQMHEAYAAGRIAGLEKAAAECLAMRTISGMDDVERGFNAALRKASEAIRNLGETK